MLPPPPYLKRESALFLDVDGTLLELAQQPDAVIVPEDLATLLQSLSDSLGGALAVVTGRPLERLDHLLAPWQVIGAGLHGAEFRWPGSTKIERAADGPVGPIVEQLRHRFSFEPAVEIEDKGVAVALHFRRAPEYASECAEAMSEITRARPNLRLLRGHFVIEALPTDANKGAAIARLMKTETFAGRVPTFVGDDVTDEDAFPTVGVLGGLCVKVGHRSSVATYGFDSPAEVLGWLRSSLSSLQSRNDDRTNS